jgi:alkyl hydroperoxide reductase subunit AhpC
LSAADDATSSSSASSSAAASSAPAGTQPPAKEEKPELAPLSEEGQKLAEELKSQLAEGTEGRAMLNAIVDGAQMGPTDGWFSVAKAQTRYPWEDVAARYDLDKDGSISPEEFTGGELNFQRLDRNHSGSIDEKDLDWSGHALARSPVSALFSRGDADGNGLLSADEYMMVFQQMDQDGTGELCLDDLKDAFSPPQRPMSAADMAGGPTRDVLLKGLARQEIGAWNAGPAVGGTAPDFTLRTLNGSTDIRLSDQYRTKPLVLLFGNFTCGPFRSHSGNVTRVFHRYHDKANFLMVYVREAHPTDGWRMESNDQKGVEIEQPQNDEARQEVAQQCSELLKAPWTMVVDRVDDEVGKAYSGMPSRLYVIDQQGKVAYKSGRGPFGFKPAEMEQSLIWLLSERDATTESGTAETAAK